MSNWVSTSELIFTTLSTHGGLVALLTNGADSIEPILGHENIGSEYVIYSIQRQPNPSKDGQFSFVAVITVFASTPDKALELADKVVDAIGVADTYFKTLEGVQGFSDQEEFYITQKFNIKK